MSNIKISNIVDDNFGNCVLMSNGIVELKVTIDFGPRVIYFARVGMENMFYQDLDKKNLGEPFDVYDGDCMKIYGGHRLWISPEVNPGCYYPDNSKVICASIPNGMEFVSPVEKFTCIQKIIRITLENDTPSVTVEHEIKNKSAWDVELAPWSITMMAPGGTEFVPQNNRQTELLPNRLLVLWPYAEMNDKRVSWGKDFITLKQNQDMPNPFKVGLDNESGWLAYFNKGQVFFKFFDYDENAVYPDGGCNCETYTNPFFLEMESLGELTIVGQGESVFHTETWELYEESEVPCSCDEAAAKKIIGKYITE